MRLNSFCLAVNIDIIMLHKELKKKKFNVKNYLDVVALEDKKTRATVFYFKNGTVVMWRVLPKQFKQFLDYASKSLIRPYTHTDHDQFSVVPGTKTIWKPHDYFNVDTLVLTEEDQELKLAIAFAIGQATKLRTFERSIQGLIDRHASLVHDIADHGKVRLSRKRINKILGEIFVAKSVINLKSEYLSTPRYFWQYSSYEPDYLLTKHYLDLPDRVEALNIQLNVLNEMFDMLTNEIQHQHSSFLEWVIIVLLVVEVSFSLLHLFVS